MIDPSIELKEGQRVSLPHETVNEIYGLLSELPAKTSMRLLLLISEQAEVVETEDKV